ncbi:hypothetical protein KGM_205526 [Danaus plexippus plexippus]|uniref:Uncharacterized protein n=1 Tax=Danaus plexippus plexippus TaxID=278856 RepID=A0A212F5N2_DANPL|nr:hypothetical protein KGM_205526 [Danaus plexippus plexippus]
MSAGGVANRCDCTSSDRTNGKYSRASPQRTVGESYGVPDDDPRFDSVDYVEVFGLVTISSDTFPISDKVFGKKL